MNPKFRFVKLRFNELRKITNATVTAFKQQENVGLNSNRNRAVCLHSADVQPRDASKPSISELKDRFDPKLFHDSGSDLQNVTENNLLHQKLTLGPIGKPSGFKNKTRINCKQVYNNTNKNNEVGNVIFDANFSDVQIDISKLQFSKSTNYVQKENLIRKEVSKLPEQKYENSSDEKKSSVDPDDENKPTYAQLQRVAKYYEEQILAMHAKTEDFSQGLHHKDIIFENNYTRIPVSCQGIMNYQMALAKMRIVGNISYAVFRFDPISIRCDMEEGAVILHWRFSYINNLRFFTNAAPRALIDRSLKHIYDEDEAISTFYVNGKGQIVKHRVDKTIPLVEKSKKSLTLVERLKKKLNLAVT